LAATLDALRLEQVLANVLDNAVKFSREHDPIDVTISRRDATVRLEVRDRGIGIPEGERRRVFERFHQGQADGRQRGLGLGLYVSREIVERHGGNISIEAPDDGGTRVVIELPGAALDLVRAAVPSAEG